MHISTTLSYYKRPEVQEALTEAAQDREVAVMFRGKGFGKRPDVIRYPRDVLEFAKRKATSFHISEERWENPLSIQTGMSRKDANELRVGWDLVLDIDCPDWEISKLTTHLFIKALHDNYVQHISCKFSVTGDTPVLIKENKVKEEGGVYSLIKEDAKVTIYTKMPESIFANAEFPIDVEIISEDIDITDVTIKIIPPKDIEFRGETLHTFSKIQKNTPVGITSQIITPIEEVNTEYKLPFEIIVTYTDDVDKEKEDSQTVSVVLRPRTFMELTTDGGIWIGDFFIAPYVSLGTIIGIPAGALLSLLIRKKQNTSKRPKKKKL